MGDATAASRNVRTGLAGVGAGVHPHSLQLGFFASAAARPDQPAVISGAGNLTYEQLHAQVLTVAAGLKVAGIKPGDAVAVMGPKGAEQVVALLGILCAGAVYVPAPDGQRNGQLTRMLRAARVRMALVCGETPPSWLPALSVCEALRVGARERGFAAVATEPEQAAYVHFVPGAAGEPEVVPVSHAAALNAIEAHNGRFRVGPTDRCLALAGVDTDISVHDVFGTLIAGGTIVAVDEEHRCSPDHCARLIETHEVTVLNFRPDWLPMLLEAKAGRLKSVRVAAALDSPTT